MIHILPFIGQVVYPRRPMQLENRIWRIEPVRVFFGQTLTIGDPPMSDSEVSMPMAAPANQTICSNCHSTMPSELRFCRNCGFRLTSELGGYTATDVSGPILPSVPPKSKRRMSGMSWIFVGLLVFFIAPAAFTALVAPMRKSGIVGNSKPVVRAVVGANFDQTDDGVLLESTSLPGGPADKAGLIGGDVILSFDGQKIENEDRLQ